MIVSHLRASRGVWCDDCVTPESSGTHTPPPRHQPHPVKGGDVEGYCADVKGYCADAKGYCADAKGSVSITQAIRANFAFTKPRIV